MLFGSIVMSMFVCVCRSVHEDISGTIWTTFTHFCACYLWPWLVPPPASLRYVMYFGFVGDTMFFPMMGRIVVWMSLRRTHFA